MLLLAIDNRYWKNRLIKNHAQRVYRILKIKVKEHGRSLWKEIDIADFSFHLNHYIYVPTIFLFECYFTYYINFCKILWCAFFKIKAYGLIWQYLKYWFLYFSSYVWQTYHIRIRCLWSFFVEIKDEFNNESINLMTLLDDNINELTCFIN